jgi:hypothetical protein
MRFLLPSSAALLAVVTLMVACNTVDPGDCYPNTSGGFGGAGAIPIGGGTGASSGDFASPRFGSLGYGAPANPCVSMGGTAQPGAPTGGTSTGSTGGGISPADQAALDALAKADPVQVAFAVFQAGYSAYDLAGMIEQSVTDPSTVSDTMLDQMASQDTPKAEANALQAVQGDASTIPQWTPDPTRQGFCADAFGCNYVEKCDFKDGSPIAVCPLANCGAGKCDGCPSIFNLGNLVVKGWCAHVCLSQAGNVIGYAANIHWTTGGSYLYCYKAANQP